MSQIRCRNYEKENRNLNLQLEMLDKESAEDLGRERGTSEELRQRIKVLEVIR